MTLFFLGYVKVHSDVMKGEVVDFRMSYDQSFTLPVSTTAIHVSMVLGTYNHGQGPINCYQTAGEAPMDVCRMFTTYVCLGYVKVISIAS